MTVTYAIAEDSPEIEGGFYARGGALRLWDCKDHEVILSGPAETGKTYACLQKLDTLMWIFPGAQAVIIRKTLSSLYASVLQTYLKVVGPDSPVTFYGGSKPEWAEYPQGSRVYFAGFDNPQKALSSERDFVYVNQAEELSVGDWEVLTTRCTGRAANAPYAQIFADCNPGPPQHWIRHRPSLTFLESRHEDNPTLFDDAGAVTDRGRTTLQILDRLTGVRKERLRYGRWVAAEGTVYADEWDESVHLIAKDDIPTCRRAVVGIDWGFTNAGVMSVFSIDGDGRMYRVLEHYRTGRLIGWWVDRARHIRDLYHPEAFVCDPSQPGSIQELRNAGLNAIPAVNNIELGIQAVKARLAPAGDGRPRLYFARDGLVARDEALAEAKQAVSTIDEFSLYVYPKGQDGKSLKETPVDADNHGLDSTRYACAYVDKIGVPQLATGAAVGGRRPVPTMTTRY